MIENDRISDERTRKILLRLLRDAGEPMAEAELLACVRWIEGAMTDRAILLLWEAREVKLRWRDGDLLVQPLGAGGQERR